MANKRLIAISVSLLIFAACAFAANLIPCPDCERPVSPRAVFCPQCGCPGDAIQEAAAIRAAAETDTVPLHPLARAMTDRGRELAIAYAEGDRRFLVMDMMLLADTATLQFTPIATNTPVSYRALQIADTEPLVRFRTGATNLLFLSRSPQDAGDENDVFWLKPDGSLSPAIPDDQIPDGVSALVNVNTNLVAVVCAFKGRATLAPVPTDTAWRDIAPGDFRRQMALLAQAADAATLSADMATALQQTQWLNTALEKKAKRLLEPLKED